MKSIIKLSLVSLCASGAVYAAQANNSQSASDRDSDKQLIVTEPAGADNTIQGESTTTRSQTTYQSDNTSYSTGATMQSTSYPSGGSYQTYQYSSAGAAPRWVTGREQDAYADCILHRYQAGKGSARATDEHYWNNVSPDHLYAQYPAGPMMYQNVASTSGSSSWTSSSSSSSWSGGQSGLWYGPDGKVYNSATSMTPIQGGQFRESAGAQQSSSAQYGTSGSQSSQSGAYGSPSSQPSSTQYGTSGSQSSTELKTPRAQSSEESLPQSSQDQGSLRQSEQSQSDLNKSSQSQPGSATSEAAGANTSTTSDQDKDQSGSQTSPQSSSSSTSTSPDQTSTSSSSATPSTQESTQSSTSSSGANQGMSEKVRSSFQSDSSLQPLTSNVTVQDQQGKVALNGTVKSEAEKQQIVSKAEEIAGSGNVIDNLQVKSDSSNP